MKRSSRKKLGGLVSMSYTRAPSDLRVRRNLRAGQRARLESTILALWLLPMILEGRTNTKGRILTVQQVEPILLRLLCYARR